MSEFRTSWALSNLGVLVDYGATTKVAPINIADDEWVLELEDIEKNTSRLVQRLCFQDRKSKSAKNRFSAGDVLYGKLRPNLNKVLLAPEPGVCTTEIMPLRCPDGVLPKFIFYALKRSVFLDYVMQVNHGNDMPRLGTEAGRAAVVPVAPTNEQRRIVAKIDSLSAKSKRAREHLDHIPRLVEKYKQAILAAAFRGELTREWRQGRQHSAVDGLNALRSERSLAELQPRRRSALSRLPQPMNRAVKLPPSWVWVCVEELAADDRRAIQSGPFGSSLLHSEFQPTGRLVVGIDNVQDGAFAPGSQNRISEEKFRQLERFTARPLDVLITVMATIGRTCVVPEDIEPAIVTKHIYRISVDERIVLPHYLMNALRGSEGALEQMGAGIRGQTRPGLNGEILKGIFIPVAPLDEQSEIVRRIGSAFGWIDRLASEATSARKLIDHLDQAVLAKAFRGELVQQDPSDEPASVLLERIRAERAAEPRGRRRQKAPG